jgi:hypothetical protein
MYAHLRIHARTHTHTHAHTHTRTGLDCQQDVAGLVAIDNANLVLATPSGKRILWAGILYKSDMEQPFQVHTYIRMYVYSYLYTYT